jgi:hypothetical protein
MEFSSKPALVVFAFRSAQTKTSLRASNNPIAKPNHQLCL